MSLKEYILVGRFLICCNVLQHVAAAIGGSIDILLECMAHGYMYRCMGGDEKSSEFLPIGGPLGRENHQLM